MCEVGNICSAIRSTGRLEINYLAKKKMYRLAGIEPESFGLLVQGATKVATESYWLILPVKNKPIFMISRNSIWDRA